MSKLKDKIWLYISNTDLKTEKEQLLDEGKNISCLLKDFEELSKLNLDSDVSFQEKVKALYEKTSRLPEVENSKYLEPSDLESIRSNRHEGPRKMDACFDDSMLYDKFLGAWLGRCSGCLLGKPIEGWDTKKLWGYLKDQGEFPLRNYIRSDVDKSLIEKYAVNVDSGYGFINNVDCMPVDDDTNYTVIGLSILKQYGRNFSSDDVASFWLGYLPLYSTCTAERVAYRNIASLIDPPASAIYMNPYREWIGAQIRADFFGYIALGNPELAAEYAWRDASISHVKNGIYGEMWVAAMLASAGVESDIKKIINTGLSEIPKSSRLYEAVSDVIQWYDQGISYDESVALIHKRWDEHNQHHWCHTISNAQIVAVGLLWGNRDFEKSICMAVQSCFDTDCNGATVGSILGMILGAEKLPKKWISPLNDKLLTSIAGKNTVRISDMAKETLELYKRDENRGTDLRFT